MFTLHTKWFSRSREYHADTMWHTVTDTTESVSTQRLKSISYSHVIDSKVTWVISRNFQNFDIFKLTKLEMSELNQT